MFGFLGISISNNRIWILKRILTPKKKRPFHLFSSLPARNTFFGPKK
jgi:hypothetical protein